MRFDDVKDEHSELDDVEFNALDVPPASNGGRVQAQELASAKDAIAADDEIDLLYDLDEELTLTADEVSYDIDDSVLFADDGHAGFGRRGKCFGVRRTIKCGCRKC